MKLWSIKMWNVLNARYIPVILSYSHTIATTSRRPLTTTFFWVVAGGCQRSANVCRWSPDQSAIGCQRITSTTSRRPPTTTFLGGVFRRNSVVGKWLSMIADQSAIGRRLVVRTVGRWEVFVAASKTFRRTKLLERLQSTGRGSELKWCGHFQHTLFTSDSRDHKLEKTGGVHSLECQPVHACCLCTS